MCRALLRVTNLALSAWLAQPDLTNLGLPLWLWRSLHGTEFICRLTCRARS